jgi:MFS family permease
VKTIQWSVAPIDATPIQRRNFLNVQVDALGIGLANAAAPFLPIFLARLGATNFQVGLLTAMPAFTGLFTAIAVGRFLQSRKQIVPWFSSSRLLVVSSYFLTGLTPFFVPRQLVIPAVLAIWALATIPQTVVNVAFTVVMNAVAGPRHRYDLMSRRWSFLGLTTSITVAIIGLVLDRINFPINYQVVFMGLSVGGLISYYYSSHIILPDAEVQEGNSGRPIKDRIRDYFSLIFTQRPFMIFTSKRFIFLTGQVLAAPLFPLYYVRVVNASDSWIGIISTVQTAVLLIGYFLWTHQSRRRGSRFVLLWTTFGMSLYPIAIATTQRVEMITLLAGLAGILQSGINLVFFDELMKTVPVEYSATFVSWAQSIQYFSSFVAPLIGTLIANQIGLSSALTVSGVICFIGFIFFAIHKVT